MKHPDPIELALVFAWVALEALKPLLVALVALVLTLARYKPSQAPMNEPAPVAVVPQVSTKPRARRASKSTKANLQPCAA
jgi:hypothetical protein